MSKISELSDGGSLLPTDFLIAVRSGGNVKVQADQTEFDRIRLGDNEKIELGNSQDMQLYHDGSASRIVDAGTGSLKIQAENFAVNNVADTENMITAVPNGAVSLFYDGAVKLATTSTGIDVTGVITTDGMTTSADINFGDSDKAVFGAGSDLQIYHDGSHSYISDVGEGPLRITTDGTGILLNKTTTESMGRFLADGAVELYYDNALKLATTSTGIDVTGSIEINSESTASSGDIDKIIFRKAHTTGAQYGIYDMGEIRSFTENGYAGGLDFYTGKSVGSGAYASTFAMRINSSGNVGINVVPTNKLNVDFSITGEGSQEGGIKIQNSHGSNNDIAPLYFGVHGGDRRSKAAIGLKREGSYGIGSLIFALDANGDDANVSFASDEVMRLSGGNLLVGKTNDTQANAGHVIFGTGAAYSSRNGFTWLHNRLSTDGEILRFQKDGTTVGSIGTANSGDLYIGNDDTTLLFAGGSDAIIPRGTAGATRDAAIDLGLSAHRFKDLYLSGGVVFGSTGGSVTSKTLDDYEEGTWTPTIGNNTLNAGTLAFAATYVKIGKQVTVTAKQTGGTFSWGLGGGVYYLSGLPFSAATGSRSIGTASKLSGGDVYAFSALTDNLWIHGPSAGSNVTDLVFTVTYEAA